MGNPSTLRRQFAGALAARRIVVVGPDQLTVMQHCEYLRCEPSRASRFVEQPRWLNPGLASPGTYVLIHIRYVATQAPHAPM